MQHQLACAGVLMHLANDMRTVASKDRTPNEKQAVCCNLRVALDIESLLAGQLLVLPSELLAVMQHQLACMAMCMHFTNKAKCIHTYCLQVSTVNMDPQL